MNKLNSSHCLIAILVTFGLLLIGCSNQDTASKESGSSNLVGVWQLKARIIDEKEIPAEDRIMKIIFEPNNFFKAMYKGTKDQDWIKAGQGGYVYKAPYLSLHWENGRLLSLYIKELASNRMLIHHGKSLAPMKDQEPDEVFEKLPNGTVSN
jgi:hypothetical protein